MRSALLVRHLIPSIAPQQPRRQREVGLATLKPCQPDDPAGRFEAPYLWQKFPFHWPVSRAGLGCL